MRRRNLIIHTCTQKRVKIVILIVKANCATLILKDFLNNNTGINLQEEVLQVEIDFYLNF